MFWCSLVGADRPPKEAMPVAIAYFEQEDLGFGVLYWERKVIRAEKIADGRVPLPARSGYISENRFLERKIPLDGIELTSQLSEGYEVTSELPGRPAVQAG